MNRIPSKSVVSLILLMGLGFDLCAQAANASDDFFRSTGKIYVVVGVLLIIFIGIIIYLISLDRKISRLENRINNE